MHWRQGLCIHLPFCYEQLPPLACDKAPMHYAVMPDQPLTEHLSPPFHISAGQACTGSVGCVTTATCDTTATTCKANGEILNVAQLSFPVNWFTCFWSNMVIYSPLLLILQLVVLNQVIIFHQRSRTALWRNKPWRGLLRQSELWGHWKHLHYSR